jgi:nucleoside-diphosphate-sugar epimerase
VNASTAALASNDSKRDERFGSKGDRNAVLITGGSGFIGRNLAIAFLRAGYRVASVDIAPTDEEARRTLAIEEDELCQAYPHRLRFEIADVTDEAGLDRVLARTRPWLVVHAAALTALTHDDERRRFVSSLDVNVAGTAKVVEAARRAGASRLVLVSSGTVYGTGPYAVALREDAELRPISTYGMSKYMSEIVCRRHQTLWTGQPEIRIVRISSPYGDWERARDSRPGTSEICDWAYRAIQGKQLERSAEGARDFTYVGDTVDGILRIALAAETRYDTYNVASGRLVPFSEVVREIINLGTTVARRANPKRGRTKNERPGLTRGPLSIDRIRDEFGFEATTTLPQGLRRYFEWIERQGWGLRAPCRRRHYRHRRRH